MAAIAGSAGAAPEDAAAVPITVSLDGEICNRGELRAQLEPRGYRFTDGSSAEALLHAYRHWDKDAVKRLRGAFAFALWDRGKQRLLLARDRFGEKPLYLHERRGALHFASAPAALLARAGIKPAADPRAVQECVSQRHGAGPRTLFEGVRKLVPGSYALWQFGRAREARYWTPPDREARQDKPLPPDPVAAFIEQLDEAVRLRMGEGEAPGLLLGGGYDSAALLALMARRAPRVKTFTAGPAGGRELARAARLAKHFGAEHHELVLAPGELAAALPQAIAARGAPLARPSDLALHALARAAAPATGALMTGEGADEIVGGYRRYAAACFAGPFGNLLGVARWTGELDACDADPRASRLRRMLYFDQCGSLPERLERGERMAASAALEARAPYLDHCLAEHVSALPDALRVRGFATKWILRQAVRRLVPAAAGAPRKGGFGISAGEWLRGELRESLLEHLRGSGSLTRAYFNPTALDRALDEHLAGRGRHEKLLWTLLNLEIWHRTCLSA